MKDMADRIIDHYERHARDWDADRNLQVSPWNDKPWHDRFIAALPRAARVLDLGCGSGAPVARHLADHGLRITGVDSSPTLVSLCRQRLPDHEWLVDDMRSLHLPGQFDGVLAWDSIFHLTPGDQRRMFEVFARHAAPSAVLMFNGGPDHGEGVGEYRGDPLYHASLSADEYTSLLGGIGFMAIEHAVEDWETGGGRTVWLSRRRA
ncbi:MAG: class I SAM-dependent DNA methyltransferase [Bradyrhizobium sp.]